MPMNTVAGLGPLAYAVIEQYGDLARTAVASSVGRRQAACLTGSGPQSNCTIVGHLFSADELSLQSLQSGNWLAVGCISDGSHHLAIEINLTTQEVRERPHPCMFTTRHALDPPDINPTISTIPVADDGASWGAA
jgi:hypothetical protein